MRKALLPMLASLVLCGAATTALVLNAHAQPAPKRPVLVPPVMLAANDAPPPAGPPGQSPDRAMARQRPFREAELQRICRDHYARQAGAMAYLSAKLDLNASQQGLFDRWSQVRLDAAKRRADACGQRPGRPAGARQADARAMPDPATMMARRETRLRERLADLDSERPALTALYAALSPSQKMTFGRAAMMARRDEGSGAMMRHRMFADAAGPGRMGPRGMEPPGMGGDRGMPPPDMPPPER